MSRVISFPKKRRANRALVMERYKAAIADMYAEYGVHAVEAPGGWMEWVHSIMRPKEADCQNEGA